MKYPKKTGKRKAFKTNRKPKKGTSKAAVKAIVKKEIARNVENKSVQLSYSRDLSPATSTDFSTQAFPLTPELASNVGLQIQQGVGQGERVGNQIKIKKLYLNFFLTPKPFDAITNPQPRPAYVILWIYYDRTNPTALTPLIASNVLQNGNTSIGLTNSPQDFLYPPNDEKYRVVLRKVFKVGYSINNGTGALSQYQSFTNNDFKMAIKGGIDCTKWIIKNVKFNDSSDIPSTRNLMYCFQPIAAIAQYSAIEEPVNVFTQLNCIYEDG